jgi:hypothetical protein
MKTKQLNGSNDSNNGVDFRQEIRRIRAGARKATSSKRAAIQFLASTGMYTASGKLKPQFR